MYVPRVGRNLAAGVGAVGVPVFQFMRPMRGRNITMLNWNMLEWHFNIRAHTGRNVILATF